MKKILHQFFLIGFFTLSGCSSLLYYPTTQDYTQTPRSEKEKPIKPYITPEEIWIPIPNTSEKLHAWRFHQKHSHKPKALILFFHGNAENLTSHFKSLEFVLPEGYDFAIFDYRGYGKSITKNKITPTTTSEDGLQFLNWGLKTAQTEKLPVIIFAQSLGGAISQRALSEISDRSQIKLIVFDSTFSSYQKLGKKLLSNGWLTWPFQWMGSVVLSDEFAPNDRIASFSPIPVVVMHGNQDQVVDYELGRELYSKAKAPKEFWHVEGGRHISAFWGYQGQFRRKFLNKCDQTLGYKNIRAIQTWKNGEPVFPNFTLSHQLPYEASLKFEVMQGFGGSFSHEKESFYGLDFFMPEGIKVLASRAGEVFAVKQDSTRGGPNAQFILDANYVVLKHEDGSFTEYYHLKPFSSQVKVGQKVTAGQWIALSGTTGFSSAAHLHLMSYYYDENGKKQSYPIVFDTRDDVSVRLEKGEIY